jgi:hypothetical protein
VFSFLSVVSEDRVSSSLSKAAGFVAGCDGSCPKFGHDIYCITLPIPSFMINCRLYREVSF